MTTDVLETVERVENAMTVRRVFGEPYERDGVTLIPAAAVRGGGGGGTQPSGEGKTEGRGAGFGMTARPAGVFEVRDGKANWRPAVDVNKIALGGQIVAIVALLTLRAVMKYRSKVEGVGAIVKLRSAREAQRGESG
jgi:uncharacterized spore protein YtfJ